MDEKTMVSRLTEKLLHDLYMQDKNGLYGYMQKTMGYHSNRIEGGALTKHQAASLFDTGYLFPSGKEDLIRAKDVEEMDGHFAMFNYMLQTLDDPLSQDLIKSYHRCLKEGVFEDKANGYAVGEYKKRANVVGNITTTPPQDVSRKMTELLSGFTEKRTVSIVDIADFHIRFERIHPFQDDNGRVGRMLIMKQCLQNGVMPVIVRDDDKIRYYQCLQTPEDSGMLAKYFREQQQVFAERAYPFVVDIERDTELER